MVSSGILILFCFLFLYSLYTAHLSQIRWVLLIGLLLVTLSSLPIIPHYFLAKLEHQYTKPHELVTEGENLILVLSSGYHHVGYEGRATKLTEAGWERTLSAIRLWKKIGGKILFIGQPLARGNTSVADYMADIARLAAIPAEAILIERVSTNTYENLLFSKSFTVAHAGKIWLVTSAAHLPRAMAVVQKLGMEVIPYPCCFIGTTLSPSLLLPNTSSYRYLEVVMHEYIGLMVYLWKGWAANRTRFKK